jgi:hypothetical protein
MHLLKLVKILFILAVLLFVAKPFVGFSIFNAAHRHAKATILVKSFTKRKLEYSENGDFNMASVQKKLADPVNASLPTFSFLLCIIFPACLLAGLNISNRFLRNLLLGHSLPGRVYLLNGTLQI